MLTHRIPPGVPETPARRYIRRAWPLLPEREVREAFARRDVKRNGARIAPADTVRGGDELTLYVNAAFPLEVIFDDGRLLAVSKPQGLPVDVDRDGVGRTRCLPACAPITKTRAFCTASTPRPAACCWRRWMSRRIKTA